ncbi:MAG TPA: FecR family protein, partial [Mycobacterium sp.]|nr:FecR family protein [Mycobacterium sp.]
MSFDISEWGRHSFAFDLNSHSDGASPTAVAVHEGPLGATATIPDSHLLFTAHFERAGADLILRGDAGKSAIVHDYFASEHRAQLLSPNGASLSADVVAALAGPLASGQYAQAGQGNPTAQAVGRVVKVDGDATIVRNGLVVTLHVGDAILKGDVLRTGTGTLGVTFNDGSTLNLTEHARLVVNQFVYDQQNSNNSEILHLVQGSLTFISGQVAHQGHMQINTPVATLGIRGTVGGVTEANDGTVSFFVAESAVGAVLTDNQGHVLAQVLQSGPTFIIRPAGPLNVLAEEVQKTPAELARELAIVQQMTSLQSVGQQIIQQFFQPNNDNNPNPQSNGHPHTQIQILFPTITTVMDETTHTGGTVDHVAATVTTTDGNGLPFGPTQIFDIPVPNGVTPPNAPAIIAADDRGAAAGAIV